jgi:hypothetical protein
MTRWKRFGWTLLAGCAVLSLGRAGSARADEPQSEDLPGAGVPPGERSTAPGSLEAAPEPERSPEMRGDDATRDSTEGSIDRNLPKSDENLPKPDPNLPKGDLDLPK